MLSDLLDDSGGCLMLLGLEDSQVQAVESQHSNLIIKAEAVRNQYDYIYRRSSLATLNARRYTAVFSFIVAEPYRGTQLNYNMLMLIMPELKARYDFLFIPVLHRLKTHQYWQRWGATEFYRDAECVCYKLELQANF